jgi:hypothetical protein
MENIEDEELLKRYLLADITQEQQQQIQDRLFVDADYFNHLLIVENEMIEDYALGHLPLSQVGPFEKHFLRSPERRRRLKVAQSLRDYAAHTDVAPKGVERPRPRFSWNWLALNPRFLVTAAMLIMAALLLWLLRDRSLLKGQMKVLQTAQSNQQQQQESLQDTVQRLTDEQGETLGLKQQIHNEQQRAAQLEERIKWLEKQLSTQKQELVAQHKNPPDSLRPPDLALQPQALWPGLGRGGDKANQVLIRAGARRVMLQLVLEQDSYSSYRVTVKNANQQPVLNRSNLKPRQTAEGNSLMIGVPVSSLPMGDYVITVQGVKAAGQVKRLDAYQFRVKIE